MTKRTRTLTISSFAVAVMAGACALADGHPAPRQATEAKGEGELVYGLPHAGRRGFVGLDEYLAYLKRLEPIDVPTYTEIEPGIYQFDSYAPHDPTVHRRFTREELEKKFGFE